jgi:hypothetical protein
MVGEGADLLACFLADFPDGRFLERLARRHDAGERRVPPRWPAGLAAEEHTVAVDDERDHARLQAGLVLPWQVGYVGVTPTSAITDVAPQLV